jgi:hypothetical protein
VNSVVFHLYYLNRSKLVEKDLLITISYLHEKTIKAF